jgi:hypothetical protein
MSNTTNAVDAEIPEDIGRNDPCPCGSGAKYKKCCQKSHRVQREAQKESTGVDTLINESTNAWGIFKLLRQVHENNMHGLFYDMTHSEGPFRARFAEKTDYIQAADAGDEALAAGPDADLRRVRIDGDDHYLLLSEGLKDPRSTSYSYQVVVLRPNEIDAEQNPREVENPGLRVWDIQRHERAKDEVSDGDLSLVDLGYTWGSANE